VETAVVDWAEIVGEAHAAERDGVWRVAPADVAECAAVLRLANERGLVVEPVGGGTKLGWGGTVAAQMMLEMRRLSGVREHVWQDMTATVGTGTTWSTMQAELGRHGQRVALDPLWPERATVGGVVAANESGSLRQRYGGLRDLVLGMTVVLADGTVARTGGKVVKNVAGYDLQKLMTGAFGTLGLVTEVTFRLHPVPREEQSWTVMAESAASVGAVMMAVLDSTLSVEAMQVRTTRGGWALDVSFALEAEALAEHAERLRAMAGERSVVASDVEVWGARERLFESRSNLQIDDLSCEVKTSVDQMEDKAGPAAKSADGTSTILKVTMLPSRIAPVLDGFSSWGLREGVRVEAVAQAVGVATVSLHGAAAGVSALVKELRGRLRVDGGAVVVLRQPAGGGLDVWGQPPAGLALMREIKRQFDAKGTLNPGRFVGGI
jgi:glycolate oxidase FAD binding subunit